ncbi:c-type cytochrome [Chitinophagaceae bacterium LWZ2-11]
MKRYIAIPLLVLMASCGESSKPSSQNNKPAVAETETSSNNDGKMLFLNNCAACHAVKKELTGPALAGVLDRWKDKDKLHAFIRNSQEVIKEDQYAKDLYNKYNKVQMTPFPWIKDEQIDAILEYINAQ